MCKHSSKICDLSWQVKDIQCNKTTDALSAVYFWLIDTMLFSAHRHSVPTNIIDTFKCNYKFLYVYSLLQCPRSSHFLWSYHYFSAYICTLQSKNRRAFTEDTNKPQHKCKSYNINAKSTTQMQKWQHECKSHNIM